MITGPAVDVAGSTRLQQLSNAKRLLVGRRLRGNPPELETEDRIRPRAPGAFVPISAEQYRIWLHSEANADCPLYNEAITIHRRGSFDLAVLEAAFAEILRRHEAWRTSFTTICNERTQVVHADLRVSLPLTDLSALPTGEREAEALRLAAQDAAKPLPLDTAALFRGRVIRMAEDEHRIYLTLHHIIFDGVSIYRIFMPELAVLYAAYAAGEPSPLPEPLLQYGDYAIWRRAHVASPGVASHLEYWKGHLAGKPPVLNLPADRPRPTRASHRGAMECFSLSLEMVQSLRALSQAHGVTLYMTLLAAFKVLLFRYSGQEDLIVGGAADARRRPELENVMGYFLDTVPLRTRPSASTRFSDFLLEVRDSVLGALSAADVPFDQIVGAVQPQRNSNHHPVFQAYFSIEPPAPPLADGWDLTQMDVTVGSSKFDLYLELDERREAMAARFIYNTDIFDAATIRRMIGHWTVILNALPAIPNCTLGALPLLTPFEIEQLNGQGGWNDTARTFPHVALHELIEAQARQTPEAEAAIFEGISWTYRELMNRVEILSGGLRKAGIAKGSLVAVLLHRSLDLLAGILAVLKAGAAYLPLDPKAPRAQLAVCIENAKPAAILTERSVEQFPESTAPALIVEQLGSEGMPGPEAAEIAGPDDIAYVIHTSGTTGTPKAVEIAHASIVNLLTSMREAPGFLAADRLLAVTTISFDIAALELFLPLISGGSVTIASEATASDPYLLAAAIKNSACTVMQATPATWFSLLSIGWRGPERPMKVLCGGEPLARDLAEHLLATGAELWNMYGPTEATVWSTVQRVERGMSSISIGKPIANTTVYVLDGQKCLLPAGVPGRLYIGGVGLARGYRGLPQATAERFTHVAAAGGARLYDTGDLAVRRPDGSIECLGRADNQVKVRGFRVELEAVEAAVRRHPQVAAAAARVWPDATGSTRLSAYVVGRDGPPPDGPNLRRFLQADQPGFMIPSDFIAVEALPLSLSGKIDRAMLPPPPAVAASVEALKGMDKSGTSLSPRPIAVAQPGEDMELTVAAWWQDMLGMEHIEPNDDFFELGGHSLVAVRLLAKIKTAYQVDLALAVLFEARTVRQLANAIRNAKQRTGAEHEKRPCLVPVQPNGSRTPLFFVHAGGGDVLFYEQLAKALGPDQPLFAFRSPLIDREEIRDTSIEELASGYIKELRAFFPRGPYLLGGTSFGGLVAFEMSQQLHAQGVEPELLVLFDTSVPGSGESANIADRVCAFWRNLRSEGVAYLARTAAETKEHLGEWLLRRVHHAAYYCYRIAGRDIPNVLRYRQMEKMHWRTLVRFAVRVYPGKITLLRAMDRGPGNLGKHEDPALGWGKLAGGGLEIYDVPGGHETMLRDPCVWDVAETLKTLLRRLESIAPLRQPAA
jgi:amino acid adenylation domain-containing protein